MIRLGLRLSLNGGREALVRLVITAAAVALGVGMLLITVAGINAVNAQNSRYAWVLTGSGSIQAASPAKTDPLWWKLTADFFDGEIIGRVDVAATGPNSPTPPGIEHLPGPGEYYASPAMSRLLRSTPSAQLADRFAAHQVGTIGAAALPGPDTLVIVIGHKPSDMAAIPGAQQVSRISTTPPSACNGDCLYVGIDANGIDLVLSVAAAAMLFPVLIFIGTAARMSAARREQRFAAMRLVGATPRQVTMVATVESAVSAVIGVAGGFALFFGLRVLVAPIPFTGERFFMSDLSLRLVDVLTVAIGVPVGAAIAALLALRRVQISPLGVTRRVTPRPPRAWRVIPLLAGLGELGYFVIAGRPATTVGQIWGFISGILIVMTGLVVAGPWLTMVCARLIARRARRAEGLIAARRLADDPRTGFRAISGLVLALFVTSVATGVIVTYDSNRIGPSESALTSSTLIDDLITYTPKESFPVASVSQSLLADLHAIPGVTAVTVVHAQDSGSQAPATRVVDCAELAGTPALGSCPTGAAVATMPPFRLRSAGQAAPVWQAADIPAADLNRLPVARIAVATDGSTSALELARSALENAYPYSFIPTTPAEDDAHNPNTMRDEGYQRLADVVVIVSLMIAGCSLAVSVTAGLNERRRPFALLRLTGAPLSTLRRVVALETVVPLLVASVVAAGTGFFAAWMFLRAQLGYTLQAPRPVYFAVVGAGVICSLAVIASTMPLLARLSGPETARSE